MATKKATTSKYLDLISKTSKDVEQELIDLSVEQAQNTLEQGTLSVKSELLKEQGLVKQAEINVGNAERDLNAAKASQPFNVQAILNARVQVLKAKQTVETATSSLKQVQDAYDYLVSLKTELF